MEGQDWNTVNVGKGNTGRSLPKTKQGMASALRTGKVQSELKHGAGSNSSAHSGANVNARKLEESEETKHATSGKSLGQAIMKARMAKKLTQKQLATAINEKPQVVGQYEQGSAIPNPQIISKLERQVRVGGGGGGGGGGRNPFSDLLHWPLCLLPPD
jgi:putative transcription factor